MLSIKEKSLLRSTLASGLAAEYVYVYVWDWLICFVGDVIGLVLIVYVWNILIKLDSTSPCRGLCICVLCMYVCMYIHVYAYVYVY